jgi:hypothetical protein
MYYVKINKNFVHQVGNQPKIFLLCLRTFVMDNMSLLNSLRNDSTDERNRVGETEGICLSPKKIAGGKTGFVIYETGFTFYCLILL